MSEHDKYLEDVLLYALGSLDAGEREAFETHMQQCAECRRELQAVQEDLGIVALTASGPRPPARSRDRFLQAMAQEPRATHRPAPAPIGKGWLWIPWFTTLAFALLAALLYFTNLRIKNDLIAVRGAGAQQAIELQQTREMLDLLRSPDAMRVTLTYGNEKPTPQGKTIFSQQKGRVLFMANNLPPAPKDKTYELWLVPKQGAPIPAGTFRPDANGNVGMMQASVPSGVEPKAFAVTIEKEEGSDTPTMPLVMAGAAGK